MNKKIKVVIAAGGTGGHVFPGVNLAKHLIDSNYVVELVTDKRGQRFLKNLQKINVTLLPSAPFLINNIFRLLFFPLFIFYSVLRSIFFLMLKKPNLVFGMGGYASFPICIAASILRIKFIIYENNLIIGKSNKYLLPLAKKILVSYEQIEGIPKKYKNKIIEVGNIIRKDIITFAKKKIEEKKINLLVLGGSQAAKVFAETLPKIFKNCISKGIELKIYQHCLPSQNESLRIFYEKSKIDFEIFNFSDNLLNYFSKVSLVITRSGSSVLAELTNAKIPFISVPLPTSADNHQLKNAIFYSKKNFSYLIEEKELNDKLFSLIEEIYKDKSKLNLISQNQTQYSDKNVYNNINQVLKKIFHEKN